MTQNRHDTPPPLRSFDQDRTILEDASGRADTPPGARERVAQLTVVWSEAERAEALRSHAEGGTRDAFLLRRLLGRGGFGEVYEGIQRSLGRVVAVKRLRPDVTHLGSSDARGDYLRRAFRQEAMTASLLEHPNIVPVYEYHEDAHGPLLAMKLVRGTPWDAMLAEDFVTMPVEAFLHKHVQILEEIGQAVAFAHSRGVVHRDLKPSQAMIGEFGEVQLMDWGLAVLVDAGRIEEAGLSRHALLIPGLEFASSPAGTPAFMAPEQAQPDARGVGTWTDVYLLGATLYYLLTGELPHPGDTSHEVLFKAGMGIVPPPREANREREMPDELVALAMRAMAPEPKDRVPSAREFVAALEAWRSGANRRAESAEAAARAAALLAQGATEYGHFAEVEKLLAQARELWPTNPAIPPLDEKAAARHAELAIEAGDLTLGRLLARRLEGRASAARVLGLLGRAEARRRRSRMVQRVATTSAFSLLAVVAFGALYFLAEVSTERTEAMQDRARGDDLVALVVQRLPEELAKVDPELKAISDVLGRTLEYYETARPERMEEQEFVRHMQGRALFGNILMTGQESARVGRFMEQTLRHIAGARAAITSPELLDGLDTAETDVRLSLGNLLRRERRFDEAIAQLRASLELARKGLARQPNALNRALAVSSTRSQLAHLLINTGQLDEAERLLDAALEDRVHTSPNDSSGWMLRRAELVDESMRAGLAAQRRDLKALRESRRRALGILAGVLPHFDRRSTAYGEQIRFSSSWIDDARSFNDYDEVRAAMDYARPVIEKGLAEYPGDPELLIATIDYRTNEAHALLALDRRHEARANAEWVRNTAALLSERNPDDRLAELRRGEAALLLVRTLGASDAPAEASTVALAEIGRRRPLPIWREPGSNAYSTMVLHNLAGSYLLGERRLQEAKAVVEEGLALAREVHTKIPNPADNERNIIAALSWLAAIESELDNTERALEITKEQLAFFRRRIEARPDDPKLLEDLGTSVASVGAYARFLGRWEEARDSYREALGIQRRIAAEAPTPSNAIGLLSVSHALVECEAAAGDVAAADALLPDADRYMAEAILQNPDHPAMPRRLATATAGAVRMLSRTGRQEEAIARAMPALDGIRAALAGTTDDSLRLQRASALSELALAAALAHARAGRTEEAWALLAEAHNASPISRFPPPDQEAVEQLRATDPIRWDTLFEIRD